MLKHSQKKNTHMNGRLHNVPLEKKNIDEIYSAKTFLNLCVQRC